MDEVEKSEFGQKGRKLATELSAGVGRTADSISKQTEQLSQSSVFQSVAHVSIQCVSFVLFHVRVINVCD